MSTPRDLRMAARTMVKIARDFGKLDMLRAQNEKQLEANPHHPLARQVAKLLESEKP